MKLYFEDPDGHRLALNTELMQYCTNFAEPYCQIDNQHRFIKVKGAEDLQVILSEADLNMWAYGDKWVHVLEEWEKDIQTENCVRKGKNNPKISEQTYNRVIKWAKDNGGYIRTYDYERACAFFERAKKDYKTASFHELDEGFIRVENGKRILEDCGVFYICLNEEGRNNYAKRFIYRIRKYEDEVEDCKSILAEIREQNEKLKERD